MEADPKILEKLLRIEWFRNCASEIPIDCSFPVMQVHSAKVAFALATSDLWANIRTEAMGDLTGYLAKTNYDVYGTTWRGLAADIKKRLQSELMPEVNDALREMSAESLSSVVEFDLLVIAMRASYAKRFRRLPDFFEKLFAIYEAGHLPCGWSEELEAWPKGEFLVY